MKLDIDARPAVPTSALPHTRLAPIPKNPERVAWLVIFGAFSLCLILTAIVPLSSRYFLLFAVDARPGTVEAISPAQDGSATVRLTLPNAVQPIAVAAEPAGLAENSVIETDQNSRAFITFFEGSNAQVFSSSKLVIKEMRQPRFGWSELPNSIKIDQLKGTVRYAVEPPVVHAGNPDGRTAQFVIHTPQFDALLSVGSNAVGSYSIESDDEASQVIVREGTAIVRSPDGAREVMVGQGERILALSGEPLPNPISAAQDIIKQGDFSYGVLGDKWEEVHDQGGDAGDVDGTVKLVNVSDRTAIQILRTGAGQNSAITGIRQQIDRDVSDFTSLIVSADVRLHNQSLSGGGYLSSEYPLIVRIKYRDVNGSEVDYVHGFYYQNDNGNPTRDGERIPQDQWIPFETGNLMTGLDPRPFRILSISIYASGWDYESYISSVRLTAE